VKGVRIAQQRVSKGVTHAINEHSPEEARLFGIKPSSGIHGSVVPWGRWLPKDGRKGQLRVMIRGWGRWYPVESVSIEGAGPQLLQ
jgi:hypothetical protein